MTWNELITQITNYINSDPILRSFLEYLGELWEAFMTAPIYISLPIRIMVIVFIWRFFWSWFK